MLFMSSPPARSAVLTQRTNVVGQGLVPKPRPDAAYLGMDEEAAERWARAVSREFSLWAGDKRACDSTRVNNFYAMQQLVLASSLLSGDVFVLRRSGKPTPMAPYRLRLHVIEADRVATPYGGSPVMGPLAWSEARLANGNIVHDGVEVDKSGAIVAYHIRNGYPQDGLALQATEFVRVEAWGKKTGLPNVLHVMDAERPEQYRGVPYLAPVVEQLLQLRRYTESELMAALVQSFFTAWIVTKTDPNQIPLNEVGAGGIVGVPGANPGEDNISDDRNEYEMGPGTVAHLEEGEDIKFGSPNIPTAGFDTFVKTFCKLIGAGLGIPYDVLIKEYNSSYSSARAALLDAWEDFRMRRKWFVDDFCQPTYEVWLAEAVALGRVNAPGFFADPLIRAAWCGARWIGPVQGSLDPLKEVKAAVLQIQHALKTHEQVTRETGGGDWDENVEQLTAENAKLAAAGGGGVRMEVDPNEKDDDEGGDGNNA